MPSVTRQTTEGMILPVYSQPAVRANVDKNTKEAVLRLVALGTVGPGYPIGKFYGFSHRAGGGSL